MSDSIDLKRIRHLVLLGEELHFSKAANRAHLSQTAFSRSIQSLEADLGVRLFDRDTRSVSLTGAGRQLIARAQELLGCANRLVAEANDISGGEGGELKFGVSPMAADLKLSQVLEKLRASTPKLTVNLQINYWHHLERLLEQEQIEFVVGTLTEDQEYDPRFTVVRLPDQAASIYCRHDHPLAIQAEPITRNQLLSYAWSSVIPYNAPVCKLLDLPANTPLPWTLSCNDLMLLRSTTISSDSLLLTWEAWLMDDLRNGVIVDLANSIEPPLPKNLLFLRNSIICHAGRSLSPVAKRTIDMIASSE